MTKYIVKRLLVLIPILLGVTLIIFTIMDFTPGDPQYVSLARNPPLRRGNSCERNWD